MLVTLRSGRGYWACPRCGKTGPIMLLAHAAQADRWHRFIHDPGWA